MISRGFGGRMEKLRDPDSERAILLTMIYLREYIRVYTRNITIDSRRGRADGTFYTLPR